MSVRRQYSRGLETGSFKPIQTTAPPWKYFNIQGITYFSFKDNGSAYEWNYISALICFLTVSHLNFTGPSTYTTSPSVTSAVDIHNHNSVTPLVPTNSQLPQSTSIQAEKPDQTSTASPKQFYSTIQSSSYLTTTENSKENPFHSSSTIRTPLTSRSATPYVGSNSTVTASSKVVIFEPTPTYESRYVLSILLYNNLNAIYLSFWCLILDNTSKLRFQRP